MTIHIVERRAVEIGIGSSLQAGDETIKYYFTVTHDNRVNLVVLAIFRIIRYSEALCMRILLIGNICPASRTSYGQLDFDFTQ